MTTTRTSIACTRHRNPSCSRAESVYLGLWSLLVVSLLNLASVSPLQAQNICSGDIFLTTQAEVDAFDCNSVEGSLIIEAGIFNLDGLVSLNVAGVGVAEIIAFLESEGMMQLS